MDRDYRTPVLLFLTVLVVGLLGYSAYGWWYPRWQRNIAEEALRRLHIALEERFMQYNRYPPALDAEGKKTDFSGGYTLGIAPWDLLSAEEIPHRVFEKAKGTHYCSDGLRGWILAYPGGDQRIDVDLGAWIREASGDLELYSRIHPEGLLEYDPTNGALSRGDILRTGP